MRPWPKGWPFRKTAGTAMTSAALDLVLKHRAIDHGMADLRIQHRHEIQRLHDIGAALAGQRNEGLEAQVAVQSCCICSITACVGLRRMAAGLQQREHQRAELMAQRQPRETDPRLLRRGGAQRTRV